MVLAGGVHRATNGTMIEGAAMKDLMERIKARASMSGVEVEGPLVSTLKRLGSSLLRVILASKQTLGWSGYGTILRSGPLQRPLPHPSQRIPLIWHM